MTKIIALFNQAGGVCKTSLAMNVGYQLGQRHHRVLLVDLDPQASLTTFMGLEPHELEETIADAVLDEDDESLPVHTNLHGVHLCPSNITLSAAELQLASVMARETRLRQALAPVQHNYDFILIDCPPSLGVLSILGLTAATHVLVPIQTHFKAFKGTELLLNTIKQVKRRVNPSLAIAGFVPTLYQSTASQDHTILEALNEQLSPLATVFDPIPRATAFADAAMSLQPLAIYAPKHPGVSALNAIASGLEEN